MRKYSLLTSWKLRKPDLPDNKRKVVFDYMPKYDYKKFISYPIEERKDLVNNYYKKTGEKIVKQFGFENFNWSNPKLYRNITIHTNLKEFKLFEKKITKNSTVSIKKISHASSVYKSRKPLGFNYYCIRMTVTFSFEGFKTGMQLWEERFVLIKAKNYDDAYKKAEIYKKKSLYKYLNSDQRLVGEKVVSIDDVCESFIFNPEEINNPEGVEVYYKQASRKMTKKRYWDVTKE
ncbi:MAG: DUF4288 domain-containing protein [Bacteroidetes bacterium]|nr:DUF4288 domain-containing protein [Bacteroidota bacterium]